MSTVPVDLVPPVAPVRPHVHELHGDRRDDPYFWLCNRDDPEVTRYLEAENAYTAAMRSRFADLEETIYQEIVSRTQETDTSAPLFFRGYWYYSRTVKGQQYPIACRRQGDMSSPEQVLLDQNAAAAGHDFYSVGVYAISPDQHLLAYAEDVKGDERYTLRFRALDGGGDLPDAVENVYYSGAWAVDNKTFFYIRPDLSMRPYQVWRHELGTPASDDRLVYEEADERFHVAVYLSKSERIIIIQTGSMVTSECWFVDASAPLGDAVLVEPRQQGVEYSVDCQEDRLLIVTNAGGHPDFRLVSAPLAAPGREHWTEVVAERPGSRLVDCDVFRGHVVLSWTAEATARLEVLDTDTGIVRPVTQPEEAYTAASAGHPGYAGSTMRLVYTSLTTPASTFDYNMATGDRELVKQEPVLGGFDRERYVGDRVWATAADGTTIPVSIVRARKTPVDGSAPCLLYGYGSYELSILPQFSSHVLSLLDRGFVYALAHVRGGGEMGRAWYEKGKLLDKRNTFTDFIACADHLVAAGITSHDRLAIEGRSAGGLLVGAVLNMRPDLCRAAVAGVPFVDALNTILDDSLPLTVIEWEEWGNPQQRDVYEYMKSYSPYDNVHAASYPSILAISGMNDTRVSYWEPAKWVARLRTVNNGGRPILLSTKMSAGHGGPSGRYEAWRETAFAYAFIIWSLDVG